MSQTDLWTYYAKELLNYYDDDNSKNVKYLAITNVTKYVEIFFSFKIFRDFSMSRLQI